MKNIDDPHTNPTFEYSVQRNVLHEKPNSQINHPLYRIILITLQTQRQLCFALEPRGQLDQIAALFQQLHCPAV